jgi:hypothetical protein
MVEFLRSNIEFTERCCVKDAVKEALKREQRGWV